MRCGLACCHIAQPSLRARLRAVWPRRAGKSACAAARPGATSRSRVCLRGCSALGHVAQASPRARLLGLGPRCAASSRECGGLARGCAGQPVPRGLPSGASASQGRSPRVLRPACRHARRQVGARRLAVWSRRAGETVCAACVRVAQASPSARLPALWSRRAARSVCAAARCAAASRRQVHARGWPRRAVGSRECGGLAQGRVGLPVLRAWGLGRSRLQPGATSRGRQAGPAAGAVASPGGLSAGGRHQLCTGPRPVRQPGRRCLAGGRGRCRPRSPGWRSAGSAAARCCTTKLRKAAPHSRRPRRAPGQRPRHLRLVRSFRQSCG